MVEKCKIKIPRFTSKNGFNASLRSSHTMRSVKSKNSNLEIQFRIALHKAGFRYRLNSKLLGKPDIVLSKYKAVIFIDGDFWHGYNWAQRKNRIKSNVAYWTAKIERNIQRDLEVNEGLQQLGWKVIRIWEHEVKNNLSSCIDNVKFFLNTDYKMSSSSYLNDNSY